MDNLLQLSYIAKTNFIVTSKSLALLANENGLVTSNGLVKKAGMNMIFVRKAFVKVVLESQEKIEAVLSKYAIHDLAQGASHE